MPGDVQQTVLPRSMLCPRLIGRRLEFDAIAQLAASVAAGQGGTIFVFGEAGVGKSRIVRAAAQHAHNLGQVVLTGRAVPAGRTSAFRPLSEALMSTFRSGGPPAHAGLSPFRAALGRLVPEWRGPGEAHAESSDLMVGEGLLRLLNALGGDAGCVLILEDMHWADPDTLAVLEYLSDYVAEVPIACLATLRTDEPTIGLSVARSLVARRAAMPLELARLSEAEVDEMARACLGAPELAGPVRDMVLSRAEGLPFLIEEQLATSIRSGALIQRGCEWTLVRRGDNLVPQTFADTIRRRLSALGERETRILRVAALLGRRFDWSLLASILRLRKP